MEVKVTELDKLAQKVAASLSGGDILLLRGELASGKTTFTQALLRQMGYLGRVVSPTFVLERRYPVEHGDIRTVSHLDFYRLSVSELNSFDWQDQLGKQDQLTIIEWPDIALEKLPNSVKQINFEVVDNETRRLTFSKNLNH